jgi:hypothetical protein
MKEQKFLIVDDVIAVNGYLKDGWEVISVTAQYVSAGSSYSQRGAFAIVIQKQK